ncbi:MAG: hypothetical protein QM698_11765 [Micropepsaceae bacterium]
MKYLAAALLLIGAAHAETTAPCTGFQWPMAREIAAAESAPADATASGATLEAWPDGAIRLSLSTAEVVFPVRPERDPKPGTGSGTITLPAPSAPGTWQVSLSGKAWVDVVQDGKALKSGAHTSDKTCGVLHKSVRFDLVAAPVTLQISGADATSIVITIMPASD